MEGIGIGGILSITTLELSYLNVASPYRSVERRRLDPRKKRRSPLSSYKSARRFATLETRAASEHFKTPHPPIPHTHITNRQHGQEQNIGAPRQMAVAMSRTQSVAEAVSEGDDDDDPKPAPPPPTSRGCPCSKPKKPPRSSGSGLVTSTSSSSCSSGDARPSISRKPQREKNQRTGRKRGGGRGGRQIVQPVYIPG